MRDWHSLTDDPATCSITTMNMTKPLITSVRIPHDGGTYHERIYNHDSLVLITTTRCAGRVMIPSLPLRKHSLNYALNLIEPWSKLSPSGDSLRTWHVRTDETATVVYHHYDKMNTFKLPTGRIVSKNASFCVATKCGNRWSNEYFKTYKGAQNEYRRLRSFSEDTLAYYNITDFKLIRPE
jgi:hypothetical protein